MSREVIIRIKDDVDGSEAAETIQFSYRGESFEIDVSSANAELFDKDMKSWLEVARKVTPAQAAAASPRRRRSSPPAGAPRKVIDQRKAIRIWANNSGFQVNVRGMIASHVIEAYQLANPTVTLLPGVANNYEGQGSPEAATSVRAQDTEDGLISAAALLSDHHDRTARNRHGEARNRHGEKLGKPQREQIRAWAAENGFEQSPAGKIKQDVLDAYYAANPEE